MQFLEKENPLWFDWIESTLNPSLLPSFLLSVFFSSLQVLSFFQSLHPNIFISSSNLFTHSLPHHSFLIHISFPYSVYLSVYLPFAYWSSTYESLKCSEFSNYRRLQNISEWCSIVHLWIKLYTKDTSTFRTSLVQEAL